MDAVRVAVITGASSGMGKEFAKQIAEGTLGLDEIWLIARRKELLDKVRTAIGSEYRIRLMCGDLTKEPVYEEIERLLEEVKPEIGILVNCAGYGIGGPVAGGTVREETGMVRLNCEALTRTTCLCIPYMVQGSRMINLSSSAAFLPQPDFAVYAASKAYVLNFSRALGSELKARQITVTAVCPGPVETPFFQVSEIHVKSKEYKKKFRADPKKVVRKALRDAGKGKTMSVYGASMKAVLLLSKILPHGLVIKVMELL